MNGISHESNARLSRSEKIATKNSARRGEISAKRTTKQPTSRETYR